MSSADILKIMSFFSSKNSFRNTIREPDQDRCSVCPDLGPDSLHRLSADVKSLLARKELNPDPEAN